MAPWLNRQELPTLDIPCTPWLPVAVWLPVAIIPKNKSTKPHNLQRLQSYLFRLLGSKTPDGTFSTLLEDWLPDSRQQDPVPAVTFSFPESEVRFVKFEVLEHWGAGGGLQFIELLQTGDEDYNCHNMMQYSNLAHFSLV